MKGLSIVLGVVTMEAQADFWDKHAKQYDRFMRKDAAAYSKMYGEQRRFSGNDLGFVCLGNLELLSGAG